MFYAADNHYSTDTDIGFANTWFVLAFDTKEHRDAWVREANGQAARAITRKQIPKYLSDTPKPFTKECYALMNGFIDDDRIPEGFLGYIDVSYPDNEGFIESLSK